MDLKMSRSLALPTKAVTSKLAFIGQSGSGKTYAAGKFAEECLGIGAQVVIIDNVGNWWGLRLAANGKSPGISIPVFGGDHADVPLETTSGAFMAELVAKQRNLSCIIDVTDFSEGEIHRWTEEFAKELLRQKKSHKTALMVIWEECHEFVPQVPQSNEARMLGAMQRLIKKGRNYGIGTALISQQPQAVSKSVLNQTEVLFAFSVNGKHEREAISNWIVYNQVENAVKDAVLELPGLEPGQCFIWSPKLLKTFAKIKISAKRTFDATATPEFDAGETKTGKLAPVDLDKISAEMKALVQKAKDENPEHLKTRIAELEAELVMARKQVKTKEVPVFGKKDFDQLQKWLMPFREGHKQISNILNGIDEKLSRVDQLNLAAPTPAAAPAPAPVVAKTFFLNEKHEINDAPKPVKVEGEKKLVGVAIEMLRILALYYPNGLARKTLAVKSVITMSGTFTNYISDLRSFGYIHDVEGDGKLSVTSLGINAAKRYFPHGLGNKPTTVELVEKWKNKHLTGKAKDMLEVLVQNQQEISRDDLAKSVGQSTSGTFTNYLSDLHSAGLIEKTKRGVIVSSDLVVP